MALTEQQKEQSKQKAIAFLEKNIFTLSLLLGVDIDELVDGYQIPVPESDSQYRSYGALLKMAENLRKLEE